MTGKWEDAGRPAFIPLDTTLEAYWTQIEIYRRMGGRGCSETMFRLTDFARRAAVAGIRERHPEYDEEKLRLAYARVVLGDDLVKQVWPDRELVEP